MSNQRSAPSPAPSSDPSADATLGSGYGGYAGPPPGAPPRRPMNPWLKGGLALVCVAIAAMWVYGLFFASKKAAYRVDDDAWRANAESVCASFEAKRLELVDTSEGYIAHPTNDQMVQRADIVDRATDILEDELQAVIAFPVSSARDRTLVDQYEGFYRTLIDDRRAYTAKLRAFDLEPYGETVVQGGPVTNVILDFTTVNEIKSCQPPGELGGDS